jgi:glycosyltransferase involved in cell wall biosynthesis
VAVRVLVFHGYLLRGTGSNVYNANLAAALVGLGHEVHLVCQERHADEFEFVGAVGDWDGGELVVREVGRAPCTVYRPDIGGLLPVYVADRYEGIEARRFPELTDRELDAYLRANVSAVAEVAARCAPDVALANHLVMGPAILARALAKPGAADAGTVVGAGTVAGAAEAASVPYAVKIHGSALEYTVKPHPRFLPYARSGLAPAKSVLVGSRHVAESLWTALADPTLPPRTRLGPPGVDVTLFQPRERAEALARVRRLADRLGWETAARTASDHGTDGPPGDDPLAEGPRRASFGRDPALGSAALRRLAGSEPSAPLVAFVGKLILSKGIDLLLAAWPLVLERVPSARLVLIGFGAYSSAVGRWIAALGSGDLGAVGELARTGHVHEGGPRSSLRFLLAFLERLADSGARERYLSAARAMPERVLVTGRLEHEELAEVLPLSEAVVVPSTFPESFGMVAVEAAACGALPISAAHSGLLEVSRSLGEGLPEPVRELMSFPLDRHAVEAVATRVTRWLLAPAELRAGVRTLLVDRVAEQYSWEGVARGVIAAARGEAGDALVP